MTTSLIGASLPRPDALGKVTGATSYPADLVRPGMLHLKVVFAERPHARVVEIDTSAALAQPGVVAVLTAADVPANDYGLILHDQPVLCGDVVRFTGDKVALVAAESREQAERAARLVRVTYADLPAVTDPALAMRPDAPQIHAGRSNVLAHMPIRKGDADAALAAAAVVVTETFSTSWQDHAFLQPEAGVAFVDERGRVVVETAGQWLHEDRRQIAHVLGLPEHQVVVRYAAIGGAFGGREDLSIQHLLALAALRLGRAVALVWSREESMIAHHKRHPVTLRCTWGADKQGRIVAVRAEAVADGGAYASTSQEVLKCIALFASGSYSVPNISVDGYAVYTNNVPSGAFRGFGAPQAQFAAEGMVDRLAAALGMDPLELRRRNLYREGDLEPTGQPLPAGVSALPVFERCVAELGRLRGSGGPRDRRDAEQRTDNRRDAEDAEDAEKIIVSAPAPERAAASAAPSHLKRGWGLACGFKNVGYSFGFPEQATATVELHGAHEVEQAIVRVGAADVGQGSHLAMRQIAAEALGLDPQRIRMVTDDSSEAPNAGSASASRLTLMAGRAVHDGARSRRSSGMARRASDRARRRAPVNTVAPATTPARPGHRGFGRPQLLLRLRRRRPSRSRSDVLTGQVRVLAVIVGVNDVGRAINREQVEAQIEGCLAQALGYALLEHFQVKDGRVLTPHFSSYLLPTVLDMPTAVYPVILELADPHGPYGARGMSEMPLVPLAAAIASAIYDATGARLMQQPMTAERVLDALEP